MKAVLSFVVLCPLLLTGCVGNENRGTLAELEGVDVDLVDIEVEGGLEKAMQSYQKFLDQTPYYP